MQSFRHRLSATGLVRRRFLIPSSHTNFRPLSEDTTSAAAAVTLPVVDLDVHSNGSKWLTLPAIFDVKNKPNAAISLASVVSPSSSTSTVTPLRFLVTPDATVQELKEDVAAYKYVPATTSATFTDTITPNVTLAHTVTGMEYPASTTLGCLLDQGDFILSLNGEQVQVRVPDTAQTSNSSQHQTANGTDPSATSALNSLTELSKMLRIRRIIDTDPRACISTEEFILLAQEELNVPQDEARTLLKRLSDAGIVHCPNIDSISAGNEGGGSSDTVFLHPHELVNEVRHHITLDAPHYNALCEERKRCQQRAAECSLELSPLLSLKETLDRNADQRASIATWAGVTGLMGGAGVYYYLTYVFLSWDLMEPVTYFTFNFFSVVAYFWWWRTNMNYSYTALRMSVLEKAKQRLYKRKQFDPIKYEALLKESEELQRRIADVDKQLAFM